MQYSLLVSKNQQNDIERRLHITPPGTGNGVSGNGFADILISDRCDRRTSSGFTTRNVSLLGRKVKNPGPIDRIDILVGLSGLSALTGDILRGWTRSSARLLDRASAAAMSIEMLLPVRVWVYENGAMIGCCSIGGVPWWLLWTMK